MLFLFYCILRGYFKLYTIFIRMERRDNKLFYFYIYFILKLVADLNSVKSLNIEVTL